jgi:Lhr-like helicase
MFIKVEITFADKVQTIELSPDNVTVINKEEANLILIQNVCATIAEALYNELSLKNRARECFNRAFFIVK